MSGSDSDDAPFTGRRSDGGGDDDGSSRPVKRRRQSAGKPKGKGTSTKKPRTNRYVDDDVEVAGGSDRDDDADSGGFADEYGLDAKEEARQAARMAANINHEVERRFQDTRGKVVEDRRNRRVKDKNNVLAGVEDDMADEDIAAGIRERHRLRKQLEKSAQRELAKNPSLVADQANLPTLQDPRLWMIMCKLGCQQEICIALMNKYNDCLARGKPLRITSVVIGTATGARGTAPVYVEAYRESHVKEAIAGINDLYGWKPGSIQAVPLVEMTQVVNVSHRRKHLKENAWVRVKRGMYKGDLGRVTRLLESGSRVAVQLVPRIDFQRLETAMKVGAELELVPVAERKERRKELLQRFRGPRRGRPKQQYFNPDDVRKRIQGLIPEGDDSVDQFRRKHSNATTVTTLQLLDNSVPDYVRFANVGGSGDGAELVYRFQNKFFRNGFVFVETNADFVDAEAPQPTLDELQLFRNRNDDPDDDDNDEDDEMMRSGMQAQEVPLRRGDNVVVIKGDLLNLQGRVEAVNEGKGTFILKTFDKEIIAHGIDTFEMPVDEVMKFFHVGDHVKVIRGSHAGETGTVTHVAQDSERWVALLFLDSGSKEISVFVNDLQLSTEVSHGEQELAGYELYDLVQIGATNIGVVVYLGRETLKVLTQNGTVQTVTPAELRGKRNVQSKRAVALDSHRNPIQVGEVVKVVAGPAGGSSGRIKHIHRAVLFLHSVQRPKNAGVFVVRARFVVQAGAKARRTGATMSGVGVGGAAGGAGRGRGRGRGRGERDPMIGKTVRITGGRYAQFLATAREINGDKVQVELHAKQKKVLVPKSLVMQVGDRHGRMYAAKPIQSRRHADAAAAGNFGDRTPALGAQTPMLGAQTPMMGAQTPMMGAQTPMMGAQTPMMGAQTPMMGAQTPMMGAQTPMMGAQTPMMGAQTPMMGGQTPRFHDDDDDDDIYNPEDRGDAYAAVHDDDDGDVPVWCRPGVYVSFFDSSYGSNREGLVTSAAGPLQVQVGSKTMTVSPRDAMPVLPAIDESALVILSTGATEGVRTCVEIDDAIVGLIDDHGDTNIIQLTDESRFVVKCDPHSVSA